MEILEKIWNYALPIGGGITVGAHKYGKIVDVNDAIDGEGPFTPERCGSIQVDKIVELCFSGKYSKSDVMAFASKSGGLSALLNTTDCIEVEKRIEGGDEYAKLVYEATIYNVAKQIGAMAAVLEGKAEAIILTGGLAYSKMITEKLKSMVSFIAPVEVYPGENELLALLCSHANEILQRDFALKTIWIDDNYFNARSMDVYITKLRKHLKDDDQIEIINIHGKGYKLITPEGE